jgi:hypothetical protein
MSTSSMNKNVQIIGPCRFVNNHKFKVVASALRGHNEVNFCTYFHDPRLRDQYEAVRRVIMGEILIMEYKQLLRALCNKLSNDLNSYNSPGQYWM